jgi:hypothetical protein
MRYTRQACHIDRIFGDINRTVYNLKQLLNLLSKQVFFSDRLLRNLFILESFTRIFGKNW